MTYEELFDAFRRVVSERDQLAAAGDHLWGELLRMNVVHDQHVRHWEALRGIGTEPPVEWTEC